MKKLLKSVITGVIALSMFTPVLAKDQSPVYGGGVKEECIIEAEDGQKKKGYAYLDQPENIESAVPETMSIVRSTFRLANRVLAKEEVTQEEKKASRIDSIILTFLNSGISVKDAVVEENGKVTIKASGGETVDASLLLFATPFRHLVVMDENHEEVRTAATITFEATGMTAESGTPYILYYSVETGTLELLTPDSVDYSGPTPAITVTCASFAPVAVVYVPKTDTTGNAVNKPAVDTETNGVLEEVQSNTWMIVIGAVIVITLSGAIIIRKRSQE